MDNGSGEDGSDIASLVCWYRLLFRLRILLEEEILGDAGDRIVDADEDKFRLMDEDGNLLGGSSCNSNHDMGGGCCAVGDVNELMEALKFV